jgi:hypothetical protein
MRCAHASIIEQGCTGIARRRSRRGTFFVAQSWADFIINICPNLIYDRHTRRQFINSRLGSNAFSRICVLSVKEVAERFSSLGTVEHPINQVLKFGLSSNAIAHEVV